MRMCKEGITISKAFFSKLLKEVCNEALQPSVIIGSFSTCGYSPFSFLLSYAFKQMPPPPLRLEEDEVAVVVDEVEEREVIPDSDETALTSKPRSCRSPSDLFVVVPASQPSKKQNPLAHVRQHMHALEGQATP